MVIVEESEKNQRFSEQFSHVDKFQIRFSPVRTNTLSNQPYFTHESLGLNGI